MTGCYCVFCWCPTNDHTLSNFKHHILESGELALPVEYLLYKHGELNSIGAPRHKSLKWWHTLIIPAMGEAETGGPLWLAAQPDQCAWQAPGQ